MNWHASGRAGLQIICKDELTKSSEDVKCSNLKVCSGAVGCHLGDGVRLREIWSEQEVEGHHDFGGELGIQWELCWGWYKM